ncbi:MAG: porin [Pirellulaceae bacterium]
MKIRFKGLLTWAALVASGGVAMAQAPYEPNQFSNEPVPVQLDANTDLITRLEAAEARLRELESRQQATPAAMPVSSGSSNLAFLNGGSVVDELDDLTAQVESNSEAISGLKDSLGERVRSGHSASTMKISGRVHADYWSFPDSSPAANAFESGDPMSDPEDRIGFRRLRFGVAGDVSDNMRYKIEMEFAGGNDVTMKDAYLGFADLPFLQEVLIGNQKRPYGLDHINSSRYNVFLERPFIVEALNQDARRLGICSYGVSDDQRYNWRFGAYNQVDPQGSGHYLGDAYQSEFAGRFANTIWYDETSGGRGYAHWAVSGSYADPTSGSATSARFRTRPEARTESRWIDTGQLMNCSDYMLGGVEGVINVGRLQAVGELMAVDVDQLGANPHLQFHGGYVYVAYFLTGEHMPWERASGQLGRIKPFENFWRVRDSQGDIRQGLGAWQLAARYSYADFTDQNVMGGVGQSFTGGLNWYWNPYARMQFGYSYGKIDERSVAGQTGGDYHTIGTRFMIDF